MNEDGSFDGDTPKDSDPGEEMLKAQLRERGWIETTAFVEPKVDGVAARNTGRKAERSAEALRKADQRDRDLAAGWRQHTVKAPDDPDARELLSHLAEAVKKPTVRRCIRAVLADPELVVIGRRVRRLRGDTANQVRVLLGL